MIHASLFSGIGGPEVAAAMLGWENAFHCEINPFGRAVLEYWFPESMSYEDITKTDFRCWRGKIDVLTGGFPCQPFSYAGKRGGREDERYLWPQMLRAIGEIRPAWVVGENVAGITTMVEGGVCTDLGGSPTLFGEGNDIHEYALRQSFTIERICRDLERLGYSVQPVLIPAAAVGAPHRRDRVFIIAHDDSNPERKRLLQREHSQRTRCWEGVSPWSCEGDGGEGTSADTDRDRRSEIYEHLESELADGAEPVGDGGERNVTDTNGPGREEPVKPGWCEDCKEEGAGVHDRTERLGCDGNPSNTEIKQHGEPEPRERENSGRQKGTLGRENCEVFAMWNDSNPVCEGLEREDEPWSRKEGQRMQVRGNLTGHDWEDLLPENRWRDFPTVSAVHRGNDGIPIRLDGISLPFSKWRTESIKAYGNAIVPQVMYRIFQAIEQATHEKDNVQ